MRAVDYGVRDSGADALDAAVSFVYIIGLRKNSFCFKIDNTVF